MCAWVALNIVIFGLIDLAKKKVSSIISEVRCRKNSLVSRFSVQNSTCIFQLQISLIVEGWMVFSCYSLRMCSEKQMTAKLFKNSTHNVIRILVLNADGFNYCELWRIKDVTLWLLPSIIYSVFFVLFNLLLKLIMSKKRCELGT